MMSGRLLAVLVATAVVWAPAGSAAQEMPDYSGMWVLDEARSGAPTDVWGQTRAQVIVVTQTPQELAFVTEGGGLSVPQELQRYRLDGMARTSRDESLGDLPNFVRKVRTEAKWNGQILTLETEHVSESISRGTGATTVGRGITSVLRLRLDPNGRDLVVERTGFRAEPPPMLHRRRYSRSDDLAYNVARVVYVRRAR